MTRPGHARRTPNKALALVGVALLVLTALITPAVMATTGEGQSDGSNAPETSPRTPVRLEGLDDGSTVANAVNDHGVVAGSAREGDGAVLPVRWDAEGNVDRLPSLQFSRGGSVRDINNSGEMVGSSHWNEPTGGPGASHVATVWEPDGSAHTLWGYDAEAANGIAHAVNEHGTIVGEAVDEFGNTRAVVWEGEGREFRDLGVGDDSRALDVNDNGDIVGEVQGIAFVIHDGEVIKMSRVPSQINAVNNRGASAGWLAWGYADGRELATFWPEFSGNTATDRSASEDARSAVEDLNEAGQFGDMVGSGTQTGRASSSAMFWPHTGGLTYLDPLEGYGGAEAHGINEDRLIVGVSIHGDREHATVWRP